MRLGAAFTLGLAAALGAGEAFAQQPAAAQAGPSHESERAREMLADRLGRTGIVSLRMLRGPTDADFEAAALSLEIAQRYAPDNLEMLRRRLEAWHLANNQERVQALTAELLRRDPADTVAQLRLISQRVAAIQEAEARLSRYDALVASASLDPSVRSRLALDAALLSRERGDDAGFVARLTRATQLDSTNKDAAVLAATYFLERSDDPLGRVELLVNVVMADPTDGLAFLNLARELRKHGAFTGAERFQQVGDTLLSQAGLQGSMESIVESLVGLWQAKGNQAALDATGVYELTQREQRRQQVEAAIRAGQEVPEGQAIQDVRLPPDLEVVRMAVNLALGRPEAAQASLRSMATEMQKAVDALRAPEPPAGVPDPLSLARQIETELLWARLWSGGQTDEAAATLADLEASGVLRPAPLARYKGWLALRHGDAAAARALLEPLEETDPQARIGLALLAEQSGEQTAAVRRYAFVALEQSGTMLGAFARRRLETLLGRELGPTDTAREIERYVASLPTWLDLLGAQPRNFVFVGLEPEQAQLSPLDSLWLRLTVRNQSRIPLALGVGRTISSRVALTPAINIAGTGPTTESLQPEVVDLGRRLRLEPNESLTVRVWGGQAFMGIVVDTVASSLTLRWRALMNYFASPDGRIGAGPTSVTADSGIVTRRSVLPPGESGASVAEGIADVQGDVLLESLIYARTFVVAQRQQPDNEEMKTIADGLLAALGARVVGLSEYERALTALIVNSATDPTTANALDDALAQDASNLVRMSRLLSRPPAPEDPDYAEAIESDDEVVSRLATLIRERVEREAADRAAAQQPAP